MKKALLLALFFIGIYQHSMSQVDTLATGVAYKDSTFIDSLMTMLYQDFPGSAKSINLSNRIIDRNKDLSAYVPLVGNQAKKQACTAFSVANALSIELNILNKRRFDVKGEQNRQYQVSPEYLYALALDAYHRGASCYENGLDFTEMMLVCHNYKYKLLTDYPWTPTCPSIRHDLQVKVPNTIRFFRPKEFFSKNFLEILNKNLPICIIANIDANYHSAINGLSTDASKYLWSKSERMNVGLTDKAHAMLIVGHSEEKRAFKVLDSRGDKKGDGGFFWLADDFIDNPNRHENAIKDAYVVSLKGDADFLSGRVGSSIELYSESDHIDFTRGDSLLVNSDFYIICTDVAASTANFRFISKTGERLSLDHKIELNNAQQFSVLGKLYDLSLMDIKSDEYTTTAYLELLCVNSDNSSSPLKEYVSDTVYAREMKNLLDAVRDVKLGLVDLKAGRRYRTTVSWRAIHPDSTMEGYQLKKMSNYYDGAPTRLSIKYQYFLINFATDSAVWVSDGFFKTDAYFGLNLGKRYSIQDDICINNIPNNGRYYLKLIIHSWNYLFPIRDRETNATYEIGSRGVDIELPTGQLLLESMD